jgi:hypothetical protein
MHSVVIAILTIVVNIPVLSICVYMMVELNKAEKLIKRKDGDAK